MKLGVDGIHWVPTLAWIYPPSRVPLPPTTYFSLLSKPPHLLQPPTSAFSPNHPTSSSCLLQPSLQTTPPPPATYFSLLSKPPHLLQLPTLAFSPNHHSMHPSPSLLWLTIHKVINPNSRLINTEGDIYIAKNIFNISNQRWQTRLSYIMACQHRDYSASNDHWMASCQLPGIALVRGALPLHLQHVFFLVWAWYTLPVQQLHSCPWKQSLALAKQLLYKPLSYPLKGTMDSVAFWKVFQLFHTLMRFVIFSTWQNDTSKECWGFHQTQIFFYLECI